MLRQIQSHRDTFIYYDPDEFDPNQVHHSSVDTVSYTWQEPRATDPGKHWYDQKSNSSGVKYEQALPLGLNRVSLRCDSQL